jgi:hypothetical protein
MNNQHNLGRMIAVCVLAFVGLSSICHADDAVGDGIAVITVCGPQGKPISNRAVQVFRVDPGSEKDEIPRTFTDAQGRVSVSLIGGLHRLRMAVSGVGFGSTGVFVVRPHETVTATMPPLAVFGRLVGTVPVALRTPGETVRVENTFVRENAFVFPPVMVDSQGKFQIDDVYPGRVELALVAGAAHTIYQQTLLVPGETRRVEFPAPWPKPYVGEKNPSATKTIAIHGTVTDTSGKPVSGASVSALVPDPNPAVGISGWPDPPKTLTAVTGNDGSYTVSDVAAGSRAELISMWAERPGYPQAELVVRVQGGQSEDVHGDFVLSVQHTALTVHVLRNGMPLAGARVQVGGQVLSGIFGMGAFQANSFDEGHWFLSGGQMTAVTGTDGIARFVDFPPSLCHIQAWFGQYPDVTEADGGPVGIQAGHLTSCTLQILPSPETEFGVFPVDSLGKPLDDRNGNALSISLAGLNNGGSSAQFHREAAGQYRTTLKSPGLYQVTAYTRDFAMPNTGWYPNTDGPYFSASSLLAVSADLPTLSPLRLQTQPHEAAVLHVRLQDRAGKPARGTVIIGELFDGPDYASTTDSHGNVDFPDMPSGQYTVRGYLADQPTPEKLSGVGPLPSPSAVTGQTLIEPLKVTIGSDEVPPVTLRPQPVGYIRLHLQLTPVGSLNDFYVSDTSGPISSGDYPGRRVDDQTGDILYGPTPVGKDILYVSRPIPGGSVVTVGTAELTVRQDAVASVTMAPLPVESSMSNEPAVSDPVTGEVMLSDGTTPAWNAHAVLCQLVPGLQSPHLTPQQSADALGRLLGMPSPYNVRYYDGNAPVLVNGRVLPPAAPTGSAPEGPVVVAWLPGLTGATIVPYVRGHAVHIVLPPALVATGKITVAGQSVAAPHSTFRVRAAYQGHGALNDLLTLDATAEPDGTFTLPGLTPGTYQIQAARDGIWLSATQTLTVGLTPPPPLTLDIPAPGVPLTLHLTDAQGHSQPGRVVSLDPEAGPLALLFWPRTVTADGNGDLHLDGLGVGRHTLGDPWATTPTSLAAFDVPPLSGTGPRTPVQQSLVLPQAPAETEKLP